MTFEQKIRQIRALRWVINARWFTITAFLIYMELLLRILEIKLTIPWPIRLFIPLFFYISAFLFLWMIRDEINASERVVKFLSYFIIPSDLIIFTLLLYFSGGLGSYVITFYFFTIIAAIAIYSPAGIFIMATFSSLLVGGEYFLEFTGKLPNFKVTGVENAFSQILLTDLNTGISILGVFITSIFIAAIMGSFISYGFRKTTQELWDERSKISMILSVIPDGIIITDPTDKITFLNSSLEDIAGIDRLKVINQRMDKSQVDADPSLETIYNILKEKMTEGKKIEFKTLMPLERTFEMNAISLKSGREIMGVIKILHDVTRERTIGRLKSEFISIAAHQLRTPLSAIKWTFRMMIDGDVGKITGGQREFLGRGYETNERMIKLVSDLLNVSRIEEGRFGYEFIKFSPEKVIEDVISDLYSRIQERRLKFEFKKPVKIPEITIDPQRIRLVFQNILENAIRYTLPGGEIKVKLEVEKDFIKFSVSDTGVGIPKYQMDRLFTKFFRGENVMRMQTEGSGLGLYIVRNIIKRHGGNIWVDSQEGVGSTFTFTLPISEEKIPKKEVVEMGI